MLLLTRRAGESLIIGDETTITILSIKGNQIRLGIEAPKNIAVNRSEVWDRIKNGTSHQNNEIFSDVTNLS
jgi:carbon storage regulator